ncbi:hypothetical protein SAMN05216251_12742 [Actinacidiphila alni]|uniref:Uncharacterized protein n=1 Tax=Actinacidiphila alni TaxID=380248 RepID=A0A1I2LCV8_9ACTN|nr:hypothetical protein SAMN05216251_12742 [Actinacidiphila alni]
MTSDTPTAHQTPCRAPRQFIRLPLTVRIPKRPDGLVAIWESTAAVLAPITGHLDRLRTVLTRLSGAQE